MKKGNYRPDAATGITTAKQERYEKKMAKYRANRARKVQLENEKARIEAIRQKNKNSFQHKSVGAESLRPTFMDEARKFFKSGKCFGRFNMEFANVSFSLGVLVWGHNPLDAQFQAICWGIAENTDVMEMWEDCLEEVFIQQLKSGVLHLNYLIADSREEALSKVNYAILNGAA